MPTAAAVILTMATTGFMMLTDDGETVSEVAEIQVQDAKTVKQKTARGHIPGSYRMPASVGYNRPENPYLKDSRYPTHVETHDEFQEAHQIEGDPLDGPVNDVEQAPQEHSLVGNDNLDVSLDASMNGVDQPAEAVVEEASDF